MESAGEAPLAPRGDAAPGAEPASPGSFVILGAGGFGRELLDLYESAVALGTQMPRFEGFLDDTGGDPVLLSRREATVLGPFEALRDIEVGFVIGLGSSAVRQQIDQKAIAWGRTAVTLIHPWSSVGFGCSIAPGTVICSAAHITNEVKVGRHVHVNVAATIGHDAVLGDYVTLGAGARISGRAVLGEGVTVHTNAVVLPGVKVGDWATLGAGAVAIRDISPFAVAVGVPARELPGRAGTPPDDDERA